MTTINTGDLVTAAEINQWCPAGMVVDFAGATAPDGWLLCDGASYLRTDYPDLFTAIGTTYGSADGTHFNVPDARDRVAVGAGGNTALAANDGVAAANRHGTRHRHTPHSHTPSNGAHFATTSGSSSDGNGASNGSVAATATSDGGSGVAADPLDGPAYIGFNKIIRAKDV